MHGRPEAAAARSVTLARTRHCVCCFALFSARCNLRRLGLFFSKGLPSSHGVVQRERLKPGMATSIHVRGDGVGSTLLRKKADPAHDWVDNLPAVAEGETVRVIETEGAFSLVLLASGEQGFIWSKYLRAAGAPVNLNDVAGAPALPFSASLSFAFVHPFSLPLILSFSKLRVFMVFEGSCVLGVHL